MVVAVDAMGSDRAPRPEVAGALDAVVSAGEAPIEVLLVGDEPRLTALIDEGCTELGVGADLRARVRVRHAPEVVTMDDHAAQAFRAKPRSSMRLAFDAVQAGDADAVVSAGHSGAILAHAVFVLGRLPGIDRPAIVTVFPTPAGPLTLCDAGANVDPKPATLAQFARLGAAYDRVAHGRARPRVGLLSNGAEPGKGTELTRAAHALLAEAGDGAAWQYLGYVEGSDLFGGTVDVVATDGFTGNVVLKTSEGLAEAWLHRLDRAALPAELQYQRTGGALLAGVDGVVVVAHGRSDATAIANAIRGAARFAAASMPARLADAVR